MCRPPTVSSPHCAPPGVWGEPGCEQAHGCGVQKVVLCLVEHWLMKRGRGERNGVCLQGRHGPRVPMQPGRMARWFCSAYLSCCCHAFFLSLWIVVLLSVFACTLPAQTTLSNILPGDIQKYPKSNQSTLIKIDDKWQETKQIFVWMWNKLYIRHFFKCFFCFLNWFLHLPVSETAGCSFPFQPEVLQEQMCYCVRGGVLTDVHRHSTLPLFWCNEIIYLFIYLHEFRDIKPKAAELHCYVWGKKGQRRD